MLIPYYRVTSIDENRTRKAPLCELFGNKEVQDETHVFEISCASNPTGTYPTSISFKGGIDNQLYLFIRTYGISYLEFDGYEFIISFKVKDNQTEKYCYDTFREALFYCMQEDERFFCNKDFEKNKSVMMSNHH